MQVHADNSVSQSKTVSLKLPEQTWEDRSLSEVVVGSQGSIKGRERVDLYWSFSQCSSRAPGLSHLCDHAKVPRGNGSGHQVQIMATG